MANLKDIPLRVPEVWSAAWYQRHFAEVLAKADVRGATGVGVTISADGNTEATLDITDTISTHEVDPTAHATAISDAITAHEAESDPHPGYLTQTEADALYESTDSILAPTVVGSLPSASGRQGVRGLVTDATATTFRSVVAGGGANIVPVFSDGTDWRIG